MQGIRLLRMNSQDALAQLFGLRRLSCGPVRVSTR
jgi:hypothetical protein